MIKSKFIFIASLSVVLVLTSCHSGSGVDVDNKSSKHENHNLVYTIKTNNLKDNQSKSFALSAEPSINKQITLLPLSDEQRKHALELTKLYAQKSMHSFAMKPVSEYVASDRVADTNNFYGHSGQPVLDQGNFGTCVTFATVAGLGYLTKGYTSEISPLDTLMQGYLAESLINSGWDGLAGPELVLKRLVLNQKPYYRNYNDTNQAYQLISMENNSSSANLSQEETLNLIINLPHFNSLLQQYKEIMATLAPKVVTNVYYQKIWDNKTLVAVTPAQVVQNTLSQGNKVLLAYIIYDAKGAADNQGMCDKKANPGGDAYYQYDINNRLLKLVDNQAIADKANSAWTKPTGCIAGGHEVLVVSYFKDANSGKLMFLIRNSWSETAGDQGNYYMSEDYLNVAIDSAFTISKN